MKSEIEHTSTTLGSQNMKSSQRMVSVVEPYELPEGWKWCRLPECVSIVTGKKDANYGTPDGKYLFFTCAEQPLRCDDYSFEGESLLLPGNGANVGQVIYYDGQFEVYQRTYVLQKTNESILLKYLYYHILGFWKNYNLDKQYGSATNYIKMGNFLNYHFPLPPTLAEQQRIVNRIESMFAKLDEAKEKAQNKGFSHHKGLVQDKEPGNPFKEAESVLGTDGCLNLRVDELADFLGFQQAAPLLIVLGPRQAVRAVAA